MAGKPITEIPPTEEGKTLEKILETTDKLLIIASTKQTITRQKNLVQSLPSTASERTKTSIIWNIELLEKMVIYLENLQKIERTSMTKKEKKALEKENKEILKTKDIN